MPCRWHFRLKASMQPTQITSLSNRAAVRICWTAQSAWAETITPGSKRELVQDHCHLGARARCQSLSTRSPDPSSFHSMEEQEKRQSWLTRVWKTPGLPCGQGWDIRLPSCCPESAWMLQSQAWGSQTGTSACSLLPKNLSQKPV